MTISIVLAVGSQAAALVGIYLTGSVANALTDNNRNRVPWLVGEAIDGIEAGRR